MTNQNGGGGRWTRLFGRPTLFSEDARRAKEVTSTVQMFGAGELEDFQYVMVIFEGLDGWERPLWASDGEWLYLRRPQGIWKTRLPEDHRDRIGMIGQRRGGSSKIYGGVQIGRDFSNAPAWHVHMQETEPESMDTFYGLPKDGYEAGPMISEWIENDGPRVFMNAGDVFGSPPSSCKFVDGGIQAEDAGGRKVRFPIDRSINIEPPALGGHLWLRFGHGSTSWMDPFDCQVTS